MQRGSQGFDGGDVVQARCDGEIGEHHEALLANRRDALQRRVLQEKIALLRRRAFAIIDDQNQLRRCSTTASQPTCIQLAATPSITLRPPAAAISDCGIPKRPALKGNSSPLS